METRARRAVFNMWRSLNPPPMRVSTPFYHSILQAAEQTGFVLLKLLPPIQTRQVFAMLLQRFFNVFPFWVLFFCTAASLPWGSQHLFIIDAVKELRKNKFPILSILNSVIKSQKSEVISQVKLYCLLFTASWFLVADHWLLITGHWLLITDYWLLVTDYWLLITDYWSLITDYWLLVTDYCSQ